jgi:hypothetical protein
MLGNNKWGAIQRSIKQGATTWSNKWGLAMSWSSNTGGNKPKATKNKEENNLQIAN